jgi:hypothetical protein
VFRVRTTCRPASATYIEYATVGTILLFGLVALVGWLSDSLLIAGLAAAVVGVIGVVRLVMVGMYRDGDEIVVVNPLRTRRLPLAEIRGYRFPVASLTIGKQSTVQLALVDGGHVTARLLDYEAAEWLEGQGLSAVGRR